ncbi:TPA: glycosyltransferase family 2 protein, partial [Enterococcus faecium]
TRVCWAYFVVLDKLVLTEEKGLYQEKKQVREYLIDNFFFIIKNKRLTFQRKISMLLLTFGIAAYKIPVKYQYKKVKAVN